jgi:3D (Asp-Asp-Asp) domain-containing protein
LRIWEKTLTIVKKRIRPLHLSLAALTAVVLYAGVSACFHGRGVIPLSTRLPVEELVQELPVVVQQELSMDQQVQDAPQPNPDAELLDLLRSSVIEVADSSPWKMVRMRVTAYCACTHCCGKFAAGLTANMHRVRRGDVFVAADKRVPFGTEMVIPVYTQERPVEVKDRGRLIKGNRLDVFFNNHKVAKKWGTKYLDVLVKTEKG